MQQTSELLNRALSSHQQGQLAEAEKIYKKILKIDSRHFDALHLLGLLKHQLGKSVKGESLIAAALKVDPNVPNALLNYAGVLCALNQHEKALTYYDRALALAPDDTVILSSRGVALNALGRWEEALACYDRALAINPNLADTHFNRGNAMLALRRWPEAIACYDRVLKRRPGDPGALLNRGRVLTLQKQNDEALKCFDLLLSRDPNNIAALTNRGLVLLMIDRPQEALACFDRVLAQTPGNLRALNNRGTALLDIDCEQALACFDQVLAVNADDLAYINRGHALIWLNRPRDALASYLKAAEIAPGNPEAHWYAAITRLAIGDFVEGWKGYKWRWRTESILPEPEFAQPPWNGKNVDGTLLVWNEIGLGDQILYGSMIPELKERAKSVMVEVEPRLVKLFARSFPNARVFGRGFAPYDEVTAHFALADLGLYLRPTWESFPRREQGHLVADPERTAALRRRLTANGEFVVGLSWISKSKRVGKFKSAQLTDFEPVLRMPGCRFIDLQYGDTLAEREALTQSTGLVVERLEDVDVTNDIDGLAALISACDLVVTVTNTTAHLTGALGQHAWVFLPQGHGRFWYWFRDRGDSPWYAHVRVKRQVKGQSWAQAIAAAADEIAAFTSAAQTLTPASP